MMHADVIVVGGGPAGSSCARHLTAAGVRVLVLDRATFPRDKCCAGWITRPVLDAAGVTAADYGHGRVLEPIRGFRTSAIGGPPVETRFPGVVSHAVRRVEFDHYLLEHCGATLVLGVPVRTLERRHGAWVVDGRATAPTIVGAGGSGCPVARLLRGSPTPGPMVLAQVAEWRVTTSEAAACRVDPSEPELMFSPDRLGYGWCVRKGDWLNVGFGRLGRTGFMDAFIAFLDSIRPRIPTGAPPVSWRGHAYRVHAAPPLRCAAEGAVLVGDAAGLADPVSGEGILAALDSGCLAALAILEAAPAFARERFASYEQALEHRFGRPRTIDRLRLLPGAMADRLTRHLLASPWFARHVLLNRWFLHADEPRTEL